MNYKNLSHLNNLTDTIIMHAIFIAVNIIMLSNLISKEVIIYPDSQGYIQNIPVRSPTYPLLLDLFETIFGANYLAKVVIFQIMICFAAVLIISLTIKNYFKLGWIIFYITYLLFLFPIFPFSFSINNISSQIQFGYGAQYIANGIATEPLAYSLFLITISIMIANIFKPRLTGLIYLFFFSALTATVRPQFIFLYLINVLFIGYFLFKTKNIRKSAIAGILLMLFMLGASIYQKTYNYILYDSFAGISFTGVQLITPQLYLSDSSYIRFFQTKEEIAFLEKIYPKMETERLNYGANNPPTIQNYGEVYNKICHNTVAQTFAIMHHVKGNFFKIYSDPELLPQLDQLTTSIALKLMLANYSKFAEFYTSSIADYMAAGVSFIIDMGRYYTLFLLIQLGFFTYLYLKTRQVLFFAFLCINIVHFMNYGLVMLVEVVMIRYSFYTDILQLVFQFIIFYYIIRFISNNLFIFKNKLVSLFKSDRLYKFE